MDMCARYGLTFNPFLKNSKDVIYESRSFLEAKARLKYLQETKGFGVITGAPGAGKTTILRLWAKNLNPSLYKIVYTPISTLTPIEFYKNISNELGIESKFKKIDNIKAIQEEVNRLSLEKRITTVFIFDEANYAKPAILNDLKIIFNFDMDSKDKAIIVLSGLNHLNQILNYSTHEPLRQRIIMNYDVDSLTKEESKAFIQAKLNAAGRTEPLFNDNALEAIANTSNGLPRLLCKYASKSLYLGNINEVDFISADIVKDAISDSELGSNDKNGFSF